MATITIAVVTPDGYDWQPPENGDYRYTPEAAEDFVAEVRPAMIGVAESHGLTLGEMVGYGPGTAVSFVENAGGNPMAVTIESNAPDGFFVDAGTRYGVDAHLTDELARDIRRALFDVAKANGLTEALGFDDPSYIDVTFVIEKEARSA